MTQLTKYHNIYRTMKALQTCTKTQTNNINQTTVTG